MKLLLDTCAILWLTSEPEKLSAQAAAVIESSQTSAIYISHATMWEVALKHATGKLTLPEPPQQWFAYQCDA